MGKGYPMDLQADERRRASAASVAVSSYLMKIATKGTKERSGTAPAKTGLSGNARSPRSGMIWGPAVATV